MGIVFFIISEVFFFVSFFWVYIHNKFNLGHLMLWWPGWGVFLVDPYIAPILNSILLLGSGMFLTAGHYFFISKNNNKYILMLKLTILCGILFELIQGWEYYITSFSIIDSVFGRIFFIGTGFHGLHVIVGLIILIVIFNRSLEHNNNPNFHVGLISGIWYWHFVDVVWLLLFIIIYWWPF